MLIDRYQRRKTWTHAHEPPLSMFLFFLLLLVLCGAFVSLWPLAAPIRHQNDLEHRPHPCVTDTYDGCRTT